MFKFLNLQPEIFAIDLNDSSIKVVKLEKRAKGFFMVSHNELKIKSGIIKGGVIVDRDSLVKIIQAACNTVKGKRLTTKYVILSLPEERSFSQIIRMPHMTQKELIKAVPFEAENYIPLPIDKVYLDFEVITPHKEMSRSSHLDVLVNVMPKYIVDSYVACFKAAGFVPYVLEIESQSFVRTLVKQGESQKPMVIIDFGGDSTSFIIYSGNTLRFTASIPFSSGQLTGVIADKLGIPFNKAEEFKIKNGLTGRKGKQSKEAVKAMALLLSDFADKINKYISFYHGHSSHDYFPSDDNIEKIVVCGGGANLKGLAGFLSNILKVPVEIGDPFLNIIPCDKCLKCPITLDSALSFTTAIGLALRGARADID